MKLHLLLLAALFAAPASIQNAGAQKITREEYIQKYAPLAIADMEQYGIPASIKMAQGLLESDNGNSRLAIIGNNHFGIKCKSSWTGQTLDHDDDAPGECFRQYTSARESWDDHAKFLSESGRYKSLWDLDPKDYAGWARGLKAAGYATNPHYPEMLVKIIEDNELWRLDEGVVPGVIRGAHQPEQTPEPVEGFVAEPATEPKPAIRRPMITPKGGGGEGIDPDNFTVEIP